MSTYGPTVAAIDWRNTFVPILGTGESEEENIKTKPIVIIDTKKIDAVMELYAKPNAQIIQFLSTVGVVPEKYIFSDLWPKLIGSALISTILSAWVSKALLMQIFILLAIVDFGVKIFFDRETSFRQKIAYFVSGFVLIGIVATLTDILFKQIEFPFGFKFSILSSALLFMNINYLFMLSQRCWSLSVIREAGVFADILLSLKEGYGYAVGKFQQRITKKLEKTRKLAKKKGA